MLASEYREVVTSGGRVYAQEMGWTGFRGLRLLSAFIFIAVIFVYCL